MKYCEEYAALLDLYVDGELSPEEMAAVQEHLDQCPDCRRYVDGSWKFGRPSRMWRRPRFPKDLPTG